MNRMRLSTKDDRPQNLKATLSRLWKYLYKYIWRLVFAALLMLSSNLLALIGPALSGNAINAIAGEGGVQFGTVFWNVGLMLLFYAISTGLSYILSIHMIRLSQKVIYQMRKDVFDKLIELPVGYFDKFQIGDIISRISYDIDTVNASLSTDLLQICTSVITIVGSFGMMLMLSPALVSVFVVTVPVSILLTKYMTGRVRPLFRTRSAKLGEMNGYVEETLTGQKTIKAYHQEENMTRGFDEKNDAAVNAYYNAEYYGSMVGPSVNFVNNLSLTLISVIGAILYLFGNITLGDMSAFVLYSRRFSGPINEAANIINELQSACAAAERVFRLLDEAPEPADSEMASVLGDVEGNVEIANLNFGYTKEKQILHSLNLSVKSKSLVAIVGATGAGKTTLINLLMRFYDPDSGTIAIDGSDIQDVTRKSLRRAFSMVLQDTWLFEGTVFDNIAYGKENATYDEVVEAAKAAKIHNFIMQLPNGYDTVLNEDGINISKGQKQLLTIARAMLLDSNMLILDEATSSVDTQTEIQIQEAMRNLMATKTCFIIAHRLSTIRNADIILTVKDGSIVEQGTHEQLMARGGLYSELYYAQFQ